MVNNPFKLVALSAFLFAGTAFMPADTSKSACSIQNQAFQAGEELVYTVYYNLNFVWVPAGEVVFTVSEEGGQYRLLAKGKTFKSYEWFFKVRDTYESYINKQTLLPSASIRDVREGSYTLYDKTTFDQLNNTAYTIRGRSKENIKEIVQTNTGDCMHDILSIIYYLRNVNYNQMKAGDSVPIKIFIDKDVVPTEVEYVGRESRKKIKDGGHFNTIHLSPQVVEGTVFKEGDRPHIWVSDDENKIPLLIESPVIVGSVKAVLTSHKGLRYDLSSKVD